MAEQPIESGLRFILKSLCNGASERPGAVGRVPLSGGLEIAMQVSDGRMWLQLGRFGQWPAEEELTTVLEHLPFVVNERAETKHFERGRSCYLRTHWQWPIPTDEQGVLL